MHPFLQLQKYPIFSFYFQIFVSLATKTCQSATNSFAMYACLCVMVQEPLNSSSLNFVLVCFTQVCRQIPFRLKLLNNNGQCTFRCTSISVGISTVTHEVIIDSFIISTFQDLAPQKSLGGRHIYTGVQISTYLHGRLCSQLYYSNSPMFSSVASVHASVGYFYYFPFCVLNLDLSHI